MTAVFALGFGLAGCRSDEAVAPVSLEPRPPIFLISVDTLRADRLPAWGYAQGDTPAIDALRRDSVLFSRAYSHTPLTLPSHATLLTGLLPVDHGVHDNLGFSLDAESLPYLPRTLQRVGYRTAAAVSSYALAADTGLGAGFEHYADDFRWSAGAGLGDVQRSGFETLERLRPWLSDDDPRPPFALFHLYEPHTPYSAPTEIAARFDDPYDAEVAQADRVVGEFVELLRELELYDRSLIVLLSDHGEGLGDHGEREHGILLYPEVLHVPLMIKLPGNERAGETVEEPVGLVDLVPTLSSRLDLDLGVELDGRNLLATELAPTAILAETLYPRLHFGWNELVAVIDEDLLFIYGPDPELYELDRDPEARHDEVDRHRPAVRRLQRLARDYGLRPVEPGRVNPETAAALSALGYAASTGAHRSTGPLPDPKSKIHTLEDLTTAFEAFQKGDHPRTIRTLRPVLDENPRLVHAWDLLARAYHRAGELEPALAAYLRAIDLGGPSSNSAAPAALILIQTGQPELAVELVRDQLSSLPNDRRLLDLEIRALLEADRSTEAVAAARHLVRDQPEDPDATYQLGIALMLAGQGPEAERQLRLTLDQDPEHARARADLEILLRRPTSRPPAAPG